MFRQPVSQSVNQSVSQSVSQVLRDSIHTIVSFRACRFCKRPKVPLHSLLRFGNYSILVNLSQKKVKILSAKWRRGEGGCLSVIIIRIVYIFTLYYTFAFPYCFLFFLIRYVIIRPLSSVTTCLGRRSNTQPKMV